MPKGDPIGRMHGFQLWANLPSSLKMTAPRYQEVKAAEIPLVTDDDGTRVRVVCGSFWGKTRPGGRDRRRPDLPRRLGAAGQAENTPGRDDAPRIRLRLRRGREVLQRLGPLGGADRRRGLGGHVASHRAENRSLVLFDRGDEVTVQAGEDGIRFLLVSGKPLEEPVAWYGPIVMNTQEQLQQAFEELRKERSSSQPARG